MSEIVTYREAREVATAYSNSEWKFSENMEGKRYAVKDFMAGVEWFRSKIKAQADCDIVEENKTLKTLIQRMYSFVKDDLSSDFIELRNDLPEWVTKNECNE